MELTLYRLSAGGRPLPAAFIASFQPKAHKRSLQSFRGDESNHNEETMEEPVRRARTCEPNARKRSLRSFRRDESNCKEDIMEEPVRRARKCEPNARKRSLRSFRRDESSCKEDIMGEPLGSLKTLPQQTAEDMLAIREEFKALEQRIQYLILSNLRYQAERDLEILNRWAVQARPNLDIADCAEAAVLSTTLPQALGEGAVADEPVTAEEHTAREAPLQDKFWGHGTQSKN